MVMAAASASATPQRRRRLEYPPFTEEWAHIPTATPPAVQEIVALMERMRMQDLVAFLAAADVTNQLHQQLVHWDAMERESWPRDGEQPAWCVCKRVSANFFIDLVQDPNFGGIDLTNQTPLFISLCPNNKPNPSPTLNETQYQTYNV